MENIMGFLSTINIVGSGLTAQQLRLDVISENITNMNTTALKGAAAHTAGRLSALKPRPTGTASALRLRMR